MATPKVPMVRTPGQRSLVRDGWVVIHDCGARVIHVALQQALAELHYSSDGIMVRDALARARELSEA
jgi:hypothetical protein